MFIIKQYEHNCGAAFPVCGVCGNSTVCGIFIVNIGITRCHTDKFVDTLVFKQRRVCVDTVRIKIISRSEQ